MFAKFPRGTQCGKNQLKTGDLLEAQKLEW